jgi:hypothetical protein
MRYSNERNVVTSFSYPSNKSDTMIEFKIISVREGKSQSEIIMRLIEKFVEGHSEGNDTFKLDQWNEDPTFKVCPSILDKDWKKWK